MALTDVHLASVPRTPSLVDDVRFGLLGSNKTLPSKWMLDARGTELLHRINSLPEYYLARRERAILWTYATEIVRLARADALVELNPRCHELSAKLHGVLRPAHHAAILDNLERAPESMPEDGRRIVALFGSAIGELESAARATFFTSLASSLRSGEHLLLSADLIKDPARLIGAYDDAAGVNAELNLNLLDRMNRELGARFPRNRFRHLAVWDAPLERIELRLRSMQDQLVPIPGADLVATFERGEELRTAVHATFRRETLSEELRGSGFDPIAWWTDPAGDLSLSLWSRA